jgi:hypothetical protein
MLILHGRHIPISSSTVGEDHAQPGSREAQDAQVGGSLLLRGRIDGSGGTISSMANSGPILGHSRVQTH